MATVRFDHATRRFDKKSAPAVDALREHVDGLVPQAPRTPLLSNRDGAAVASGALFLAEAHRLLSAAKAGAQP